MGLREIGESEIAHAETAQTPTDLTHAGEANWRPYPRRMFINYDQLGQKKTQYFVQFALIFIIFYLSLAHISILALGTVAAILVVGVAVPIVQERRERRNDLALLEDYSDSEVCLVTAVIYGTSRRPSYDRGVAFFENNALHFIGRGTSFVVGGQDTESPDEYGTIQGVSALDRPHLLLLRHPTHRIGVILRPAGGDPVQKQAASNFTAELKRFREQRLPSDSPRQLPPTVNR